MALEPHQLITFAVVARTGSVSVAAHQLHRSQPAVSAQLRRLQDAVGEPLYVRERYGIRLTSTGEALLPIAQTLARALESAQTYVHGLKEGQAGHLRLAASTTVALYLLPGLLKRFHDRFPATDIRLLTGNTREAVDLLSAGEADLAVIEGPVDQNLFVRTTIAEDEIVLAVLPGHPLAARAEVPLQELTELGVVRREIGSGTRAVVDRVLTAHGVRPHTVLEAKGVDAIKEAVLQGLGAGFISRLAIERERAMGLLVGVRLDSDGFKRPLTLLAPQLELCSHMTRRFIHFLESR